MELKVFMESVPTFSQMERVQVFNKHGLIIRKVKSGILIEYTKANNNRYCAMVSNPIHYEREIEKVKGLLSIKR